MQGWGLGDLFTCYQKHLAWAPPCTRACVPLPVLTSVVAFSSTYACSREHSRLHASTRMHLARVSRGLRGPRQTARECRDRVVFGSRPGPKYPQLPVVPADMIWITCGPWESSRGGGGPEPGPTHTSVFCCRLREPRRGLGVARIGVSLLTAGWRPEGPQPPPSGGQPLSAHGPRP